MIKRILAAAWAVLPVPVAARAFNPEEHKLVGDLGSHAAAVQLAKLKLLPQSRALIRVRAGGGDAPEVRLVMEESIPKVSGKRDARFKGFVPREGAHRLQGPILVWVGKADGKGEGGFYSLGDLVALYG